MEISNINVSNDNEGGDDVIEKFREQKNARNIFLPEHARPDFTKQLHHKHLILNNIKHMI